MEIESIINGIIFLCIGAVFTAVSVDFLLFQDRRDQKKEKKSPVATLTMTGFFFLFYLIEKQQLGILDISGMTRIIMVIVGLLLMVIGAFVNIVGRIKLGSNWSDHVKIYQNHSFIGSGAYSLVRHPLYASLIWMFYGSSLVYANWLAFLANSLIFVPAMYYRAKQEEEELNKEFSDYKNYQLKTGMFFPRF